MPQPDLLTTELIEPSLDSSTRQVTQSLLVEGKHRVRIYEPGERPPVGFQPIAPTLEDAYLLLVKADKVSTAHPEPVSESEPSARAAAGGGVS
ncbi:MAG: hypothetical protein V3T83_13750 [Acidobacteriota bacterium]